MSTLLRYTIKRPISKTEKQAGDEERGRDEGT